MLLFKEVSFANSPEKLCNWHCNILFLELQKFGLSGFVYDVFGQIVCQALYVVFSGKLCDWFS